MRKLIARRPVLWLAKLYKAGDALPTNNPGMVEAWLKARTATWEGEEVMQDTPPVKAAAEGTQEVPEEVVQEAVPASEEVVQEEAPVPKRKRATTKK